MKMRTWFYIVGIPLLLMGCPPSKGCSGDDGMSSPTTPIPVPGQIWLTWDKNLADLDLYVTLPSGEIADPDSVVTHFASGYLSQDISDGKGFGPEFFTVTTPLAGNYTVKVNYHWHYGQTANVTATVIVFRKDGSSITLGSHVFTQSDADSYSGSTPPNAWVVTSTLTFP